MGRIFSILWGERSLPFTFWVCYIGGTILGLAAIYGLVWAAAYFGNAAMVKWSMFFSVSWGLFITYFVGTAVVLSANNRKPQDVWTWLAIAAVSLVALQSAYDIMRTDGRNTRMAQEQIFRELKSFYRNGI